MVFAFYSAREAETYAQFLSLTRRHLSDGAPSDHPFWTDRAVALPPEGDDRAAVQAAFDRLREATTLTLAIDASVRFETRPALAEREIVLERRLVAGGDADGVRFLNDRPESVLQLALTPWHRLPASHSWSSRVAGR
jgi:hypothetical protein